MADEHISFKAMVNHEVGPLAHMTHSGDLGLCADRTAPVANAIGAKLGRLARALEAQRQREVDWEIGRLLARSGGRITDSMEREMMWRVLGSHWNLPQ